MARIFLVDDSKFMRNILKNILKERNHTICGEAANGKDAVLNFFKARPDLVIIDINLPDFDGIEVLRRIKTIDPNVKAIICSSMGQRDYIMEAYQAGAYDFIVKPFEPSQILASVEKTLKRF
ncbi:Chemotaxis protein CheY [Koleobacter methoxysyntrophicus]|jgi:two-component system chemotaxis response regulator CheY|uniref:Stage 0 sporulation protein A homolog n=1 Tax=Koleobacter methoxysyntrophicus TaxID=2751313 RepID=A0A8A0RPW9_9FIRM|nr:response regulator [Koleobacter methoxysyntrophicus]MDK2901945.1 two-component system, chemotaxis family, chemotaxis protein CheY [Thermosediminibacterales bacterium]QSQ09559.1 Chemotaxis protein CheY [Koleobacter methoxysyntrophicus]